MFSSNKDDWETPQALFDELNKQFNFNLDAAATMDNKKCEYWLHDALISNWNGRGWCNPPYSRGLQGKFIKKAYDEFMNGNAELVVMLLPARTDTKAFHEYIYGKAEIKFLKGRLKFEVNGVPSKNAAPFPSMLVIYR